MVNIPPVIKWSGSKRSQAVKIVEKIPDEVETYYEPFCGGASVFIRLAASDKKVKKFVISDLNNDLINLWQTVLTDATGTYKHYGKLWKKMKSIENWELKKRYYESIRERFNKEKSPYDFMFLLRTAFNGMPRYNKSGLFNTPLHPNRDGIYPEKLLGIMNQWNEIISKRNIEFLCQSFESVSSKDGDFLYLDPPYIGVKGMYYGVLPDYAILWNWMQTQSGTYVLSFDGKTTTTDLTYSVPTYLYENHEYLYSGNSSFRRITGASSSEYVSESLYIK